MKAEIAINLWREFLYVTGGTMRSSKCAWTLMDFKRIGNTFTLQAQENDPGDLYMPDDKGKLQKIPR